MHYVVGIRLVAFLILVVMQSTAHGRPLEKPKFLPLIALAQWQSSLESTGDKNTLPLIVLAMNEPAPASTTTPMATAECVNPIEGWSYEWTKPFNADVEEEWREAIDAGEGGRAYDILEEYGDFYVEGKGKKSSERTPLCRGGVPQYEFLRRLALGGLAHVLPDAALKILNHAIELPDVPPEHLSILHQHRGCLYRNPEPKRALEEAERAVALNPNSPYVHAYKAYMLGGYVETEGIFRRVHNWKKIIRSAQKALELGPNDGDVLTELVSVYAFLPQAAGGDGRLALRLARAKAEIDPASGNWDIGRSYASLGRHRDAERHFLIGMDQSAEDTNLTLLNGLSLSNVYLRMGREDDAFEVLNDLKKRFPKRSTPLYRVGVLAARTNSRHEEGKANLKAWLEHPAALNSAGINCEVSPDYAYAHYRLGQLHDQLDEIEQARTEYKLALQLAPDLEEAELALKRLPK